MKTTCRKKNPIPSQPLTRTEKIMWTLALVAWAVMVMLT